MGPQDAERDKPALSKRIRVPLVDGARWLTIVGVTGDTVQEVYRHGLATAGAGMALGLPAAFLLARMARSLIWDVTASDPATFAGVALVLLAVAAVAIYVPARRAVRVDPTVALRCE